MLNKEQTALKNRVLNELYKLQGGYDPFEFYKGYKEKFNKNYLLKKAGKKTVPLTDYERRFIQNHVPFEKYLDLCMDMVYDDIYPTLEGVPVSKMDQFGNLSEWLGMRQHGKGYLDPESEDYKVLAMGGSGAGAIVYGLDYPGGSKEFVRHRLRELPFDGPVSEIDPHIALAGHAAEAVVRPVAGRVIERCTGENVEILPYEEVLYEHAIFSFMQGNMDGLTRYADGSEGVLEIKHTDPQNFRIVDDWKNGVIQGHYLVQLATYMAIGGYDFADIVVSWGFRDNTNMHAVHVVRNLDDEANLFATMLYFLIEEVIKDYPIKDELVSPEILIKDLYAIHGESKPLTRIELEDKTLYEKALEIEELRAQKSLVSKEARVKTSNLDAQIAALEAAFLSRLEDKEMMVLKGESEEDQEVKVLAKMSSRTSVDTAAVRALKDPSLMKTTMSKKLKIMLPTKVVSK